jgi:DHA1 family tetracycline resistance protein-like MFS transporter
MPALQGMATRRVGPSQQGQLQGAFSSVMGIALLIGPSVFTQAFAAAIDPGRNWNLPGAPFLLASALLAAALVLSFRLTRSPA